MPKPPALETADASRPPAAKAMGAWMIGWLIPSRLVKRVVSIPYRPARIASAAFSAIITVGDAVLPDTILGMIDASITRSPRSP